jgi:hypothetical protein
MLGMMLPVLRPHNLRIELALGGGIGLLVFLALAIWDERLKATTQSLRPPDNLRLYRQAGAR